MKTIVVKANIGDVFLVGRMQELDCKGYEIYTQEIFLRNDGQVIEKTKMYEIITN